MSDPDSSEAIHRSRPRWRGRTNGAFRWSPAGHGDDSETSPRRSARGLRTMALVGATGAILYVFVVPQLARGMESSGVLATVDLWLLAGALTLQLASLVAYSLLTRVSLPAEPRVPFVTLLRIQLATKALAHVVPGGTAAGSALGYRLLTRAGVHGAAAGFSLASVGLGSAIVLNVIVWVALVVSIPVNGVQPVYSAAAIIGAGLLAAAAALVFLLLRGRAHAERVVRWIPFVDGDAAAASLHRVADRLHEIARRRDLLRSGVGWAAANWLLDAASLWVVLRAFDITPHPVELIVAFGIAQVLTTVPVTPAGLGLVEGVLPALLVAFGGMPLGTAVLAVLVWRLLQFWLPIPLGAAAYGSLRLAHRRSGNPPVAGDSPTERSAAPGVRAPASDSARVGAVDHTAGKAR
ncbi:MAG: YbhN family protein [Actinomycetota bacterium]